MKMIVCFYVNTVDDSLYQSCINHESWQDYCIWLKQMKDIGGRMPVIVHELNIDPCAGYQSCEAFQLDADGKHQVDVDLIRSEKIKQL